MDDEDGTPMPRYDGTHDILSPHARIVYPKQVKCTYVTVSNLTTVGIFSVYCSVSMS